MNTSLIDSQQAKTSQNQSVLVDCIADLRLVDPSIFNVVQTTGYYPGSVLGGGLYRYNSSDSASAENGGTKIVGLNGSRWDLIYSGSTHLYQWGVIGNKIFDDTSAVNAALAWASELTASVIVPSCVGIRLTSTIEVSGSPRLLGEHIQISRTVGGNVNSPGAGSWFFIDHTGVGFRFNKDGVVVKRPWIELIGTYRTQPDPGAQAYTPTAHDYDYVFYNCDSVVRNIVIWNSTKGIYITADASNSQSRGDISGVYGCPVQLGIVVDFLADVLRVDNVHFWPYWTSNANFAAYQRSNAVGMSFYRCDNPMITRYFTYGYRLSIYMGSNSKGVTSKLKMQVFDFDFIGQSGVLIDGSGISCALSGGSGQGHSAKTANNFLEVTSGSSGCNVSVDNIDVGLFKQNVLRCGGAANSVMRVGDNVRLYQWNGSGVGFPAIGCTENNFVELSTMPYFTAPLNEGTPLDTAGNIKGRIELPRRTYNTDANGRTVLQSGMGRAPSSIVATAIDDSVAYSIQQTSIANVVLASTVSSGAALVNSKIVIAATLGFS